MSFEPKTKIELDPPKDDIISLEYLSKCDGKLSDYAGSRSRSLATIQMYYTHSTGRSDMAKIIGTNPDYPTYVAIKGTVFDVSGNKAYGPDGSYKGKSNPSSSTQYRITTLHPHRSHSKMQQQ
jgi:predicted heme/steroid binding protein